MASFVAKIVPWLTALLAVAAAALLFLTQSALQAAIR